MAARKGQTWFKEGILKESIKHFFLIFNHLLTRVNYLLAWLFSVFFNLFFFDVICGPKPAIHLLSRLLLPGSSSSSFPPSLSPFLLGARGPESGGGPGEAALEKDLWESFLDTFLAAWRDALPRIAAARLFSVHHRRARHQRPIRDRSGTGQEIGHCVFAALWPNHISKTHNINHSG